MQVGSQKNAVAPAAAPPPVAAEGSPAVSNDFVGPRKSKNKADTAKPTPSQPRGPKREQPALKEAAWGKDGRPNLKLRHTPRGCAQEKTSPAAAQHKRPTSSSAPQEESQRKTVTVFLRFCFGCRRKGDGRRPASAWWRCATQNQPRNKRTAARERLSAAIRQTRAAGQS